MSEGYFEGLENRLENAIDTADDAREEGGDPAPDVEIPVATDLADRVENLIGIEGLAERLREYEESDLSREDTALELAEEFADGEIGEYDSRDDRVEAAIRTAVALLTEGVVAAPIEGIDGVDLLENDDGSKYIKVEYAGPIRSAGGTAQALSVLIADYVRTKLDVDRYKPRDDEIERYIEEINLYDEETGLQYSPKNKESRELIENCSICLGGEPTSEREVSGYRDLERIDTNRARGGMCLVAAEGIAQKAPKIKKHVTNLGLEGWDWLDFFIKGGKDGGGDEEPDEDEEVDVDGEDTVRSEGSDTGGTDGEEGSDSGIDGDLASSEDNGGSAEVEFRDLEQVGKFLYDLTAGRPIFSHPSREGGFRLRYGRARNTSHAAAGINPATMVIFDDFLASGTQLKTERPGKAAGVAPVDSIDGPTVRLRSGEVRRIDDVQEAYRLRNGVEEIIDVGEIAVNYGEFLENNHPLAPASYVYEWWIQDLEETDADVTGLKEADVFDLREPTGKQGLRLSDKYGVPLHPRYTYLWHDIEPAEYVELSKTFESGEEIESEHGSYRVDDNVARTLEKLLVHHVNEDGWIYLSRDDADVLGRCLNSEPGSVEEVEHVLRLVRKTSDITVRRRAPTRIGCRMGRPEKSEKREMTPAVHCLFPIGESGGSQRDIDKAASYSESMEDKVGEIEVQVASRECQACGSETYKPVCSCGGRTEPVTKCRDCGTRFEDKEECPRCGGDPTSVKRREIDIKSEYRRALDAVEERDTYDILKCVKGLTSENKTPEPLEKGVLRAKHDVSAFKDGTIRYDMTDLPLTSFKPNELDVSVEKLREMGYERDMDGEPLEDGEQVVELKIQDVVLSDDCAEYMVRVAGYVDDLLTKYYGEEAYYEVDDRNDLVGEMVMGLAPHTSAGVLGRVVGFTSASVGYAHPFFHAAKRRNCFHPKTRLWYNDDGWRYGEIQEFVEEHLSETDDTEIAINSSETSVSDLDKEVVVPSVNEEGETVEKQVVAVSRHPVPDRLLEIETRSGRKIKVTPDHSMVRWKDGGTEKTEAAELETGNEIPSPKKLDFEGTETYTLDLLEEFIHTDSVSNRELMVHNVGEERLKRILGSGTGDDGYLKGTADRLGVSQSTAFSWVDRGSVPVEVFVELFGVENALEKIPDSVDIGLVRDTSNLDRWLKIDEDFGKLLGYYAAEGFSRASGGSFYQTTICIPDTRVRGELIKVFEDKLSASCFKENEWKITVSNRLVAVLFREVLGAGYRADMKKVPRHVMDSPLPVAREFLRGYFSGDGSVASDTLEIRAQTVSNKLVSDLIGLLKRFGITAKVNTENRKPESGGVAEFHREPGEEVPEYESYVLKITSENAESFSRKVGFDLDSKSDTLVDVLGSTSVRSHRLFGDGGDVWLDEVVSVCEVETDVEYSYCLTVEDTHTLVANDIFTGQCDGDEDCVMMLMDGLLNFSKSYLPDKRGGRMDAPLVLTTRVDPEEIDDEAHNVDKMSRYPREFYLETLELADPKDIRDRVDLEVAEDTLGDPKAVRGFDHSVETSGIALGPDNSAYKTLGSMLEKTEAQLEVGRKTRAVDESDVAERVVESHFLPDLIGNLRAFTKQEFRCLDCNTKYRRPPLSGKCSCGGDINLTVHEGSVKKYLDVSLRVGEEYGVSGYTLQRLRQLERQIDSLFEDDKARQSGIAEFM
ncbi:MAG: DNA polymerase II large subunit [Halobacteria archaeon]